MKKVIIFFSIFFPISVFGNTFTEIKIETHTLQYITYPTNSELYDIQIGLSEKGSNLREIMGNYGGITAINGVFFCPSDYSQCNGENFTINERFSQGREISTYKSTGERVVFAWDGSEKPFLHQTDKINIDKRSDIYEGVANFPLLLESGENKLEHYYDVGLIDYKMRIPLTRHFICTNQDRNKIIFGRVTNANMDQVVKTILTIGCYDAINLDAGRSSSFLYNGKNIIGPGRDILDGIVISRNDIDIKEINTHIDKVFYKIEQTYTKKFNIPNSIKILQSYRNSIYTVRTNIYKKYTKEVTDLSGNIVGYTIPSLPQNTFKKVYILNVIDHKLQGLIQKLEIIYEARNNISN